MGRGDICETLSQFSPISFTNDDNTFSLGPSSSSSAAAAFELPDPNLFFTWYCEKAREIERNTGSVDMSLQLLESALKGAGISRLSKRFLLATRSSLLKYRSHLASLSAKLNDPDISAQEKADILHTLRTIDLKEFEKGLSGKGAKADTPQTDAESTTVTKAATTTSSATDEFVELGTTVDWSDELTVLNLILEGNLGDALSYCQKSIFFPSAILEGVIQTPREWLSAYCKSISEECDKLLNASQKTASHQSFLPVELCNDPWITVLQQQGISLYRSQDLEEQNLSLVIAKANMALVSLHGQNLHKSHNQQFLKEEQSSNLTVENDVADVYF